MKPEKQDEERLAMTETAPSPLPDAIDLIAAISELEN
jgi:hypothetical protein